MPEFARLEVVTVAMAFTEAELQWLKAKAVENGLGLNPYINHVVREMLRQTRRPVKNDA
jgi:hypothetical protein